MRAAAEEAARNIEAQRAAAAAAAAPAEAVEAPPVADPPDAPTVTATDDQDRPGAWSAVRLSWSAAKSEVKVYGGRLGVNDEAGFWAGVQQLLLELAEDAGVNKASVVASLQRVLLASGHPWGERLANGLPFLMMFLAGRGPRR